MSKIIKKKLKDLKLANNYRIRKVKDSGNSHIFVHKNKEYLSFASNDYLSLSNDKRIINAAKKSLDNHGYSTSSSALISGYTKSHMKLEEEISDFLGQEKTLLFSTGYQANLGVIKSLVNRNDTILSDKLNHASLIDGSIISRASFKRYRHNDFKDLENLLLKSKAKTNLVISDSLFSMDGDIADLKKINKIVQNHESLFLIDEAHALGVYGNEGRGFVNKYSLNKKSNIFVTGTFGKSIGTFGAFTSGQKDSVEYVMQKARSYIYSTSLPVNAVEATRESLKIIQKENWRREKLFSLVNYFRKNISESGFNALDSRSQIQAILIGSSKNAIYVSEQLLKNKIYIPAIRPPTVEEGKSRLRVSITTDHEESDIDHLINILHTISRNLVQS